MDVVVTEEGKLHVRMVTGYVVRVQLEAGRDGVNTTKVAVVEGLPLEKVVELKRMKSEDDKKRGEKEEQRPFFSMIPDYASWRCGGER